MTTSRAAIRPFSAFTLSTPMLLALLGAITFLIGLVVDHRSAWTAYLIGFTATSGLALSGSFFLAIAHVARARWARPIMPICEALAECLPLTALLGTGLLFGMTTLYPWARHADAHLAVRPHMQTWLSPWFFGVRMIFYFGIWWWASSRLLEHSRRSYVDRESASAAYRAGILFIAVFAVTFSLASWDWLLSLEPEWFSSIWALVTLSGVATSGLGCLMIAAARRLDRTADLHPVRPATLDDLGKLGIALSMFWAYIAYCQWMLIWYTNIPEETGWHHLRHSGAWKPVGTASLILNGIIPFFLLMPKKARRSPAVLLRIGAVLLLGRLVDLWHLVGPPVFPTGGTPGWIEFGIVAGFGGLFFRTLSRHPWFENEVR